MKKLLSVLAFAFVMVLSVQNATAQERPEAVAKTQVAELSTELGLNGDQQRTLFRALVANEINYRKYVNGKDMSSASVQADKKKFDTALDAAMKKNLTADQYNKWNAKKN